MSYTTGEIAKMCDITVRTVQYYDKEGLLHPSGVSEGGRRLYSEGDVAKLKKICMLKSLGVSLAVIKEVLVSENGHEVLQVFLEEQERKLTEELEALDVQRQKIRVVKESILLGNWESVRSQEDICSMMLGKKRLRRSYALLLVAGVLIDLAEIGGILWWIVKGNPWPFIGMWPGIILLVFALVKYFYRETAYICPECHSKFKPKKVEWFLASHTIKLRKLTCTACGYRGFCIETYSERENEALCQGVKGHPQQKKGDK